MQPQSTLSSHLCECGCGSFTPYATRASALRGVTAGEPSRFLTGHRHRLTPEARFWAKVDTSGDCWLWRASCDEDGYGLFSERH